MITQAGHACRCTRGVTSAHVGVLCGLIVVFADALGLLLWKLLLQGSVEDLGDGLSLGEVGALSIFRRQIRRVAEGRVEH